MLILAIGANAFTISQSDLLSKSRTSIHDLRNRVSVNRSKPLSTNGKRCTICHNTPTDEPGDDNPFWENQKKLISEFTEKEEKSAQKKEKSKYGNKVQALVSESLYFSVLIFSALWLLCNDFFTPVSYLLGASLGTAYCFGLGKFVATVGGTIDDIDDVEGSAVGSARFAFLILLIVVVGKFRAQGLQEIPAISGFFTYQIASLSQGLKDAGE